MSAVEAAGAICAAAAAVSVGSCCVTVAIRTCSGIVMWLFSVVRGSHVIVVQV